MNPGGRYDPPPYVRVLNKRLFVLGISPMVLHLALLGVQIYNQSRAPAVVLSPSPWWFAVVFLPFFIGLPFYFAARRRLARRLRACAYAACLFCGYSIEHLQGPGRCPECGLENDPAESARRWKLYFAPKF